MASVEHFAFGWSPPALAAVVSFLGWLLGLILTARSRDLTGAARLRWLVLAAVAIGGVGLWLMRFMALLGFDVPDAQPRYHLPTVTVSLVLAVITAGLGLSAIGFGSPPPLRILAAGGITGVGLAALHFIELGALRFAGAFVYSPAGTVLTVALAVVIACGGLWAAAGVAVGSRAAAVAAALALGSCGLHYLAMLTTRVRLVEVQGRIDGVSPFVILAPVSVLACVVISALAYAAVGASVRGEHAAEEASLERTRKSYAASLAALDQEVSPVAARGDLSSAMAAARNERAAPRRPGQLVTSRPANRAHAAVRNTRV